MENNNIKTKRQATTFEAYLAMLVMLVFIGVGNVLLGMDLYMMLLLSIVFNIIICFRCHLTFEDMKKAIGDRVGFMATFCLILLGIGFLVSSFMMSGTIPVLVAWLAGMIDPKLVILLCFIFNSILSLIIGSSFATVGTMGVIMMSVANLLGVDVAVAAGACISGAMVGQYMSPIADVTNLATQLHKISMARYLKDMLPNALISFIIASVIFAIVGHSVVPASDAAASTTSFINAVNSHFNTSILVLLPIVVVAVLSFLKFDALIVLYGSAFISMLMGVFLQGFSFKDCINAGNGGFSAATMIGDAQLPDVLLALVNRGGISSMGGTIVFVVFIMSIIALLEAMGALDVLRRTAFRVRENASAGRLALQTTIFSTVFGIVTCEPYINIIVTTEVARSSYVKAGIDPRKIATLCNGPALATGFLLPYGFCAIYVSSVLGVKPLEMAPWAIMVLLVPVVGVILAFLGTNNSKLSENKANSEVAS